MDNPFSILSDGDDEDDDEAHQTPEESEDEEHCLEKNNGIERAAMLQIVAAEGDDAVQNDEEHSTTFIEDGLEKPVFFTQKAYVFNQKFSHNAFYGRCYLCGCPGHSQRYCSLKYCAACDTYGHSPLTCPDYPNIRIPVQTPPQQQQQQQIPPARE